MPLTRGGEFLLLLLVTALRLTADSPLAGVGGHPHPAARPLGRAG